MSIIRNNMYAPGKHAIIDCKGAVSHFDEQEMLKLLHSAAHAANATVLSSNFHHFGEGCGITGVLVLTESHITVHTWPEKNYAAFDVFMCGDCETEKAAHVITKNLKPESFRIQLISRDAGSFNYGVKNKK